MSFSVDQLVADCLDAVHAEGRHGGAAVSEILDRAIADPQAIESAIGHPSDQAMLSTWFTSDELTVLHIVWPPDVELTPHDHLMWASIGLYAGREDNRFYRVLPEGNLEQRQVKTMLPGDTVVLGDDAVHAVANPSREWTGAIHVYGGDFFRSGRRVWLDPDGPATEYRSSDVQVLLGDAADRAREREAAEKA